MQFAPILLVKSSSWNNSSSAHFSDPEAIERFEMCLRADRVPKTITMIQFPNLAQANQALKVNMGELKGFVTSLAHQKSVVPWAFTEQDVNPDLSELIVIIINQLRLGYNSSAEIAAHIINKDFLGPFVKGDASTTVQSLNSSESLTITKGYLRHITTCYDNFLSYLVSQNNVLGGLPMEKLVAAQGLSLQDPSKFPDWWVNGSYKFFTFGEPERVTTLTNRWVFRNLTLRLEILKYEELNPDLQDSLSKALKGFLPGYKATYGVLDKFSPDRVVYPDPAKIAGLGFQEEILELVESSSKFWLV